MSTEHVAKSCSDILGLSPSKAQDLSLFAKHQGFSCLGTWTREECLTMGEELLERQLDCRVIPFNEGLVPDSIPEITVTAVDFPKQEPSKEDTFLLSYSS
jgi:hypothetical protein